MYEFLIDLEGHLLNFFLFCIDFTPAETGNKLNPDEKVQVTLALEPRRVHITVKYINRKGFEWVGAGRFVGEGRFCGCYNEIGCQRKEVFACNL